MNQAAVFALLAILGVLPSYGQQNQADSQTLQTILVELRSIHNDVRLSSTTQILLVEMQIQQTAVDRTTQRRDDMRAKLQQVQSNEKNLTTQIARFEDSSGSAISTAQKQGFADNQANLKIMMASLKAQEQDDINALQEAEALLRRQQDTLDGIKQQLDQVVKRLQPPADR